MQEIQTLEMTLKQVDRRRAEIEQKLQTLIEGSYAKQEMLYELVDLTNLRNVTDLKLRDLREPPSNDPRAKEHRRRRQKMIEREIAVQTQLSEAFIAKLEQEGDHLGARQHRMAMLDIPAQVAREFGE